jgi:hypothetical protein
MLAPQLLDTVVYTEQVAVELGRNDVEGQSCEERVEGVRPVGRDDTGGGGIGKGFEGWAGGHEKGFSREYSLNTACTQSCLKIMLVREQASPADL